MISICILSNCHLIDDKFFNHRLYEELLNIGFRVTNNMCSEINEIESFNALIKNYDIIVSLFPNYNTFFMLGYANARNKNIVIVCKSENKIPDILSKFPIVEFNDFNLIEQTINNTIKEIYNFNLISQNHKNNKNDIILQSFLNSFNYKDTFNNIDGKKFEELVFQLFNKKGDIAELNKDMSGLSFDILLKNYKKFKKTLVEVKKSSINNKISINQLHLFLESIDFMNADHGIYITTSDYTEAAKDFAKNCLPSIELWNINNFIKYFKS